ncbi:MAG: TFIIB-type zinc ribbon-containing protein [Crenarchaeota archaeon]|nr:TFIIB-type zinc ribbon-containing protein [Thermoproteota archaeon]
MQVLQLYATRRVIRCPVCGSGNVVLDYHTGQLICRSCGTVIEEEVFDFAPTAPREEPVKPQGVRRAQGASRLREARALTKLSLILGADAVDRLTASLALEKPENLLDMLRDNPCIRRLVQKLRRGEEKAAAIHVAYMLKMGSYPLYAELAENYGIERRKVLAIARKVRKCLSIESPAAVLARA